MKSLRSSRGHRPFRPVVQPSCIEPLEHRQLLSCTVNVQLAGGGKAATVTVGEVLNLQVWATVTGTEPGQYQGLQDVIGSFIGTPTTAGSSVVGDLAAQVQNPFNGTASQNGTSQDLNGDGGDDVGGTDPATGTGYFAARADSMQTSAGVVSGDSQAFEIGTLTYTVKTLNAGDPTDINFVPDSNGDFVYAVWREDINNGSGGIGENPGTSTFSVGAPMVVSAATVTPTQPTTGSVSGNVSSSAGGIAGVTVYLDTNNNSVLDPGELSTTTDSSGNYSFANVPPGAYIVRQILPSGDTQITPYENYGNHVAVTAGEGITGQNFTDNVPAASGSVSGNVSSSAGGIAGVTIYLDTNNNSILDPGELSTTTDSSGNYSFANVPTGAYIVRQILPSGDTQITPYENYGNHITVTAGESITGQNFTDNVPAANGSVSGNVSSSAGGIAGVTVYLDTNNNSILDPGELSTTTDSSGNYSFANVPPGAYIVRQILPSGDTQITPYENYGNHITVTAADSVTGQNFTDTVPAAGGSVSGNVSSSAGAIAGVTVYLDTNNNSILDPGELSTTTDSSGNYSFANVPPGAYIVRQILPTGDTQITPYENYGNHITVTAGDSITGQNFTDTVPATGGSVSGTVTAGSSGVAGITVYLDTNNNSLLDSYELSTTTNSSGYYSFTNVPPGAYIVRQILPGGDTQITPYENYGNHVSVSAGQSITNQNFTDALVTGATISGTVFNDANNDGQMDNGETGISGVELYIDLDNNGAYVSGDPQTSTDASGDYSFVGLGAGTYIVRVVRPAGDTQTLPTLNYGQHVTVAAGQTQTGVLFGLYV